MDYQNRAGSKKGGGGVAGDEEANRHRSERIRQLLGSSIDIANDPYVFRNHLGVLECKLCYTTHNTEASYIAHVGGKKHQMQLMYRARSDQQKTEADGLKTSGLVLSDIKKRKYTSIGRPGYKVTKIRDPVTYQKGLLFQLSFKELSEEVSKPRYRLMSSFEQKVETPPQKNFQYLVISGEPYENVSFKVPVGAIDRSKEKFWDYWDQDTKEYFVQFFYEN
ncbi:unnamed protein product [Kuraishia capsulata CBS 1993]|uniref:Uncharacterized protein n=1 Tax=Kuraishia capsulata CBS 1993 TaxID=1382522 RepID=W6MSA5_9ASCO|nr:uncharacterized protein KUCA_T00000661001 [Kuraishia capsulata CBS 1993]CDK24695.1 unnamed protein product [Kuraishia capsulata CBS 1993]